MIEKMKAVCIAAQSSHKDELLTDLRDLGILHIAEKSAADPRFLEEFSALFRVMQELKEYKAKEEEGVLSEEKFDRLYADTSAALAKKAELREKLTGLLLEEERLAPWGNFDPQEVKELSDTVPLRFYLMDKKELSALSQKEGIRYIRLRPVGKSEAVAVVGHPEEPLRAFEFPLPQKGLAQVQREAAECRKGLEECESTLKEAAGHLESFRQRLLKVQNAAEYSSADASLGRDSGIVWVTGFIPQTETEKFSAAAQSHGWAWMIDDADENDADVPTKIRYNKVTALIRPLFAILGTVPGYKEYDISFWFLAFFALFFAMIIGDAGYGALFLIGTIILNVRMKKLTNVTLLLYLLSATTIVWGALTGTWFGLEGAMKVPFLKALVIPGFANYPEYFDVSSTAAQNNVMKFCFSIGVIQLALACVMNIRRKICGKDLGWIADVGWLLSICALYFMVLFLVIGESVNLAAVACAIGAGFLLVVLFGGMSPDKSFAQGLKAGLGNAFTAFLNTISAFGNVMSYIRLFAVGMASLAIAQSFNGMAAGFGGPLVIVGIAIMVIGHALNIVMGFLSVVVHGVRLNLLEFSGQLGMEWSGIAYEPFREIKKEK